MSDKYHIPVLADAVRRYLITEKKGIYVDGTVGGGGHAKLLLKNLEPDAVYIGLDQDSDALEFAKKNLADFPNVHLYRANFADMRSVLDEKDIASIHGVFLDLGVSSRQIDNAARGFSFMQDAPLDMRMNRDSDISAVNILNEWSQEQLADLFYRFGEERRSRRIAAQVVRVRRIRPVLRTGQLREIIERSVGKQAALVTCARVFQALRIEVNQELRRLEEGLRAAFEALLPGGRIVVLSYHSLEDRRTKEFFRSKADPCQCPPELPQCICGKKPQLKILTRKAVKASEQEIAINSRARSVRLRAGEKL